MKVENFRLGYAGVPASIPFLASPPQARPQGGTLWLRAWLSASRSGRFPKYCRSRPSRRTTRVLPVVPGRRAPGDLQRDQSHRGLHRLPGPRADRPPVHRAPDEPRGGAERDSNYSQPLFVTARFMNRDTGEIKEQQVFLGDFPIMTDKGVFIINGTERVIVSQLVRSPGIYYDVTRDKTSDKMIYSGKIIPGRGAWIEFDTDKKDTIGVRVDRKRRQYVTAFLKALGIAETDEEILELFGGAESIRNTIEKDTNADKEEALLDLYRKLRPGEPTTVESARSLIQTLFRNPKRYDLTRVGRYKMAQKFGEENPADYRAEGLQMLRDEDMLDAIRYLVALHAGQPTVTTSAGNEVASTPTTSITSATGGSAPSVSSSRTRSGSDSDPSGAGRARADDHPGPRSDHAAEPDQHPSGHGRDQGVLRDQPAQPVHGPAQPAGRADAPTPPQRAGPGRALAGARRFRGPRRPPVPLRPDVPDRDPGRPEHRADRITGVLRPSQRLRVHRDAVPQGGEREGDQQGRVPDRHRRGAVRHRPGQRPPQGDGSFVNDRVLVRSGGGEVDRSSTRSRSTTWTCRRSRSFRSPPR
jgi:hypothetical protein